MDLPVIDDFRHLFLNDTPLMDVRAPIEFSEGAFPNAENHPLMLDQERHEVGLCYKEDGQDAAVELGHKLVSGDTKKARVGAWRRFAEQHPGGVLYCFRGGMRSEISQRWLHEETGLLYPRIKGGYKALRHFLMEELEQAAREIKPIVIGGRTGVGKTLLLQQLDNSLDLERLAWHRGSAFGLHATPQPSQIDFENALSIALLKHRAKGNPALIIEDESRNIGSRNIPNFLFDTFKKAPLLLLEETVETRVDITLQEYVVEALGEYQALYGQEKGFLNWSEYLVNSLDKIRKRLGGARHQELRTFMLNAIAQQSSTNDTSAHRDWIAALLIEYYDPMYDYQIKKHASRVAFKGDKNAIKDYLLHHSEALTS